MDLVTTLKSFILQAQEAGCVYLETLGLCHKTFSVVIIFTLNPTVLGVYYKTFMAVIIARS
jgi:hypothetical protein